MFSRSALGSEVRLHQKRECPELQGRYGADCRPVSPLQWGVVQISTLSLDGRWGILHIPILRAVVRRPAPELTPTNQKPPEHGGRPDEPEPVSGMSSRATAAEGEVVGVGED